MAVRHLVMAEGMTLAGAAVVLSVLPASVLLMYVLLWPLLFVFAVRVHTLGIDGYDAYGRRLDLAWPFAGSMKTQSLLGLEYLVVEASDSRRNLWLPLFLDDRAGFDRLVAECAGRDHPLARRLGELR